MKLLLHILMLLSLGFNLGASSLEHCASTTGPDGSFQGMNASHSSIDSGTSAFAHGDIYPSEGLCHHSTCHFGHCAHFQLWKGIAVSPANKHPLKPARTSYLASRSSDFFPNHDRPPRLS